MFVHANFYEIVKLNVWRLVVGLKLLSVGSVNTTSV